MKQDYFGTSKTEFNKAVKKAVHQSNIEQAKQMKDWKKEFDKKWNSCNCEGGFDCGQCSIDDNLSVRVGEESWEWLNKKIKSFISSLLLSQRKEVIEECYQAIKKEFSQFGRKNKDKLESDDFGYHLPEIEEDDVITDVKEIKSILNKLK